MKSDIKTREDLEFLLTEFYKIVPFDAEIGHHFNDVDLTAHLPIIVDFWEKVLFGKPVYFNNPLEIHQKLHEKFPLKLEHFDRWVEIFKATIDRFFTGETAETAKFRAVSIAQGLNSKLNPISIQKISKTSE